MRKHFNYLLLLFILPLSFSCAKDCYDADIARYASITSDVDRTNVRLAASSTITPVYINIPTGTNQIYIGKTRTESHVSWGKFECPEPEKKNEQTMGLVLCLSDSFSTLLCKKASGEFYINGYLPGATCPSGFTRVTTVHPGC